MQRYSVGMLVVALFIGGVANAQQPAPATKKTEPQVAPAGISPEAWAYIQELRRQDDPKLNAMRAAQFKTQQRQARLATQAWFGYSNSRPMVSPEPFMSQYSPMWVGNTSNPAYWAAGGYSGYSESYYVEQNFYRR